MYKESIITSTKKVHRLQWLGYAERTDESYQTKTVLCARDGKDKLQEKPRPKQCGQKIRTTWSKQLERESQEQVQM